LQAGGRRFDPVWLHQAAPQSRLQINRQVKNSFARISIRHARLLSGAGVMSDIVKRRSIRAFGVAVIGRDDALSPIRDRRTGIGHQDEKS
jgi:hypothetical protein